MSFLTYEEYMRKYSRYFDNEEDATDERELDRSSDSDQ